MNIKIILKLKLIYDIIKIKLRGEGIEVWTGKQ